MIRCKHVEPAHQQVEAIRGLTEVTVSTPSGKSFAAQLPRYVVYPLGLRSNGDVKMRFALLPLERNFNDWIQGRGLSEVEITASVKNQAINSSYILALWKQLRTTTILIGAAPEVNKRQSPELFCFSSRTATFRGRLAAGRGPECESRMRFILAAISLAGFL